MRLEYLLEVRYKSSESTGFSFALHKFEDVSDSDGTFYVTNEVTFVGFLTSNENDLDLGDTSSWSCSSEELGDSGFDWFWFHVAIIISII